MPIFSSRNKKKGRPDKGSTSTDGGLKAEAGTPADRHASDVSDENGQPLVLLPGPKGPPEVGLGVRTLYEPQQPTDAIVDIVFVHGLTGNSSETWFHKRSNKYWPIDLLSRDLTNSRILTFGYDADVVHFWNPASGNRIGDHARKLVGGLAGLREEADSENRKIIFVAHSLGGLVVQDCLWYSNGRPGTHLHQVASCTIGIAFLGTPHHGADLAAWAKFGSSITKIIKYSNSSILAVLEQRSEVLARVQHDFHTLLRQRGGSESELAITCFFEELAVPVIGFVVEKDSAIIPGYESYGIYSNHMDMARFGSNDDDGYMFFRRELRRWMKKIQPAHGPTKTVKTLFSVPFQKDNAFIDRADIFKEIDKKMIKQQRVTLSGLGGIGKSQIAIEYCYRFRKIHPDAHVVWIYAASIQRFDQSYKDLARRLKLPGWDDPNLDTLQLVTEWFSDPLAGRWLMVLDNADDMNVIFSKQSDGKNPEPKRCLIDYLPTSGTGSLLVTTKDNRVGKRLRLARDGQPVEDPVAVGFMSLSQGQELLQSQLGELDNSEPEVLEALINALGRIPLAITQAAAFIQQNSITLSEYLEMFNTDDSEINALLEEDSGDLRRDSESQNSVFRTWKLAFDLIQKQKPRAAEILSLMSVLDYNRVPRMLFQDKGEQTVETTAALGILQAFCLINSRGRSVDNTENVLYIDYELHRLTQLATQKWLEIQNKLKEWQKQAVYRVQNVWPDGFEIENWIACELLLPHALKVLEYDCAGEEEIQLKAAAPLHQLGTFDVSQGRYEIASTRHLKSLDLYKELRGKEDPCTLAGMSQLAAAYYMQGHFDKAEQLQEELVETKKRVLGADHPNTLITIGRLALTYVRLGRLNKAEQLQEELVETKKRVLGADHPITLTTTGHLAFIYGTLGRLNKAEQLKVQVVEAMKRTLGPNHPETLTGIANLARIYRWQNHLEKAEELQLHVLENRRKVLKANHPATLSIMRGLAMTYIDQGRWDEAEKLQLQAIEGQKKVLGADHPDFLRSLENLATIYYWQKRLNEAEQLGLQILATRNRVLGPNNAETLTSMHNMAYTYLQQGRRAKAIGLMLSVVELREKTLGKDHPDTTKSIRWLKKWSTPSTDSAKSQDDVS